MVLFQASVKFVESDMRRRTMNVRLTIVLVVVLLVSMDRSRTAGYSISPRTATHARCQHPFAGFFDRRYRARCHRSLAMADPTKNPEPEKKEKGIFDFLFNPYESKIPKQIEKDIYAAEANTPAAQERSQRVALYALFAFTGILCAFFNGFLTELRSGPDGTTIDDVIDPAGFGWVYSNFVLQFIFTNKIGGFICLLGGGACGLLAEAEYDTRRINAEKIFDEMQRRRAERDGSGGGAKKRSSQRESQRSSKRRSGKESKRISALSEVTSMDETESVLVPESASSTLSDSISTVNAASSSGTKSEAANKIPDERVEATTKDDGIFGKIKGLYEQADSMAATQALLLNKKLEDQGLIEKITDETGLKVIGKEAAAAARSKEKTEEKTT